MIILRVCVVVVAKRRKGDRLGGGEGKDDCSLLVEIHGKLLFGVVSFVFTGKFYAVF